MERGDSIIVNPLHNKSRDDEAVPPVKGNHILVNQDVKYAEEMEQIYDEIEQTVKEKHSAKAKAIVKQKEGNKEVE